MPSMKLYKAFTSVPGKPCCEIIRTADEGEGVRVRSWDPNGPMYVIFTHLKVLFAHLDP